MSLWTELRRRHIFRIAAVYAATGWLVLQLGAIVFPALRVPPWALPLLIGFVTLGFPVALVLAWAFEITPEGVRRTELEASEAARPAEHGRRIGRLLNRAMIGVLALALALLLWRDYGVRPQATDAVAAAGSAPAAASAAASARSIAVLPFANDGGDPKDRYFSDGLSEDLIIALSQYPELRVIGRESSFHFRGSALDGRAIGRQLGVAHLLEGSVSRVGEEVRIRAELVNAADGTTLWSEHYDRPYKDLFALQDDITKAVASALEAQLQAAPGRGAAAQTDRPPSGNLAAYNAFLQGNFYTKRFSEIDFRRAIEYYRQAVKLDPDYAAAYAALAYASGYLASSYLDGAEMQRTLAESRAAADKALQLDPKLAAAYRARGTVLLISGDWKGSMAAFRRALQLAPGNSRGQSDLANALAIIGRLNEAVELQRKALAADPLDAHAYYRLGMVLFGLDRVEQAQQAFEHAIVLQPTGPYHYALSVIEADSGHPKAALAAAEQELNPNWKAYAMAMVLTAGDDRAKADAALQSLIAKYQNSEAYQVADVYAFRGQPDEAFAWLERARRQHDGGISLLLFDPFLLRYKDDPRFGAFCRKVGLPPPH